jgi:hypothetical protein
MSRYFQLVAELYSSEFQEHKSLSLGKSEQKVNLVRKFDSLSDKGL